jgi:hypothetical protein
MPSVVGEFCPPFLVSSAFRRYVSSMGATPRCWAVGGLYAWLLGGTCRRWGVRVEGRAKVNHDLRRGSPCQRRVSTAMVGLDVSAGGWEERLEKTNTMKVVFVLVTHWPDLPPVFILPQILRRARTSRPHSSIKGEGGCASVLAGAVGDCDVVRYAGLG